MKTSKPRKKNLIVVTVDAGCNVAVASVYVVRSGKPVRVYSTQRCGRDSLPREAAAEAALKGYLEECAPCEPVVRRIDLDKGAVQAERERVAAILAGDVAA